MKYLLLLLVACSSKEEAAARNCHQYPYEPQCPCRSYVGSVCRVDQRMVAVPSDGARGPLRFYCECTAEVIP